MLSTWKMVYIYILYKESMRIDWVIGNYPLVFKRPKINWIPQNYGTCKYITMEKKISQPVCILKKTRKKLNKATETNKKRRKNPEYF